MRLMQSNQKVTLYCQILPVLDANCSQIHLSKSLFRVFDPFFSTQFPFNPCSLFDLMYKNINQYLLCIWISFSFFKSNVLQEI